MRRKRSCLRYHVLQSIHCWRPIINIVSRIRVSFSRTNSCGCVQTLIDHGSCYDILFCLPKYQGHSMWSCIGHWCGYPYHKHTHHRHGGLLTQAYTHTLISDRWKLLLLLKVNVTLYCYLDQAGHRVDERNHQGSGHKDASYQWEGLPLVSRKR